MMVILLDRKSILSMMMMITNYNLKCTSILTGISPPKKFF